MSDFLRAPLTPGAGARIPRSAQRDDIRRGAGGSADAAQPARAFHFSDADFEKVRALIYTHAGISLSPAKKDMVYGRLARRLRACGDANFASYLKRIDGDTAECEIFTNSLTTNLTAFFREAHHFDILAERLKTIDTRRPIKIWCAAASSGEEAYSIAMTACEAFGTLHPPVQILASDIDTQVLAKGEAGVFSYDRVACLSPARLHKFFLKGKGSHAGEVMARAELKRLLAFRRINLLDVRYPVIGPLDFIFCRNVMIYFDKPTQYGVLRRFSPLLKPDGLLFAGHSESFLHATDLFRSRGRTVYEHRDAPAS